MYESLLLTFEQEVSAAEIRIQKEGIAEIFDQLHNYTIMIPNPAPTRASGIVTSSMAARDPNIWHHLTGSMKGSMLIKITGKEWNQWSVSSTDDYKPDDQFPIHPDDKVSPKDEVLNFIFPKTTKYFADTSTGRDRTEQALDTSAHVSSIIQNRCSFEDSDEIVGELQFCYITGMVLGNLACMEHWAHMIKVFQGSLPTIAESIALSCIFLRQHWLTLACFRSCSRLIISHWTRQSSSRRSSKLSTPNLCTTTRAWTAVFWTTMKTFQPI